MTCCSEGSINRCENHKTVGTVKTITAEKGLILLLQKLKRTVTLFSGKP